ncbi:DUF2061 domain-containing protein [Roseospirillum parvum]|uniref:Uncharacterized membrane protein n=1 Tax=Roseospirillum parvum TaxID=83401 RepID=A0A1G8B4Y9_9PROT|nr:DUF2061 domain-containing protein [Roseospirillum parvum]SDH27710.1 Uncharacterized membrane protein [Roseospirillum parvum]
MIALKTFSFAVIHLSVAFSVAYALTGDIGISSAVALLEPACNTVAFYFHERVWRRFQKGGAAPRKAPAIDLCCGAHG